MKTKPRRKSLDELQEKARKLTRSALSGYSIPEHLKHDLVLGVYFDGDERIFELYVPGERPEDAQVLTSARLNSFTGEGEVEVFSKLGVKKLEGGH